jgi:hypothetical protein
MATSAATSTSASATSSYSIADLLSPTKKASVVSVTDVNCQASQRRQL